MIETDRLIYYVKMDVQCAQTGAHVRERHLLLFHFYVNFSASSHQMFVCLTQETHRLQSCTRICGGMNC